jgi:integrase
MTSVKLKYVTRDRDRYGNYRLYYRRPGKPKILLPGLPGSDEFMTAYKAALRDDGAAETKAERSLDWLCNLYFRSTYFQGLEEYTRRRKHTALRQVCDIVIGEGKAARRLGSLPYRGMNKASVRKLRDMRSDAPEAANFRLKQISALYAWAFKNDHIAVNPAAGVERLRGNVRGFYTWTERDVEIFEAAYPMGAREHVAMSVMLYLGVRRSDAVRLGPRQEAKDGKSITFDVWKGRKRSGKVLTLPILPPLRAALDAAGGAETYLTTASGKPHASGDSFGNWFRDACRAAGLAECSPHGLRKIAAVRCAEAGASEFELMAMFGWDDASMARDYIRQAQQKKMAISAAAKSFNSNRKEDEA